MLTLEQCTRGERSLRLDTYWAPVPWLPQRSLISIVNPVVSLSCRLMTEITLKCITQTRNCLISRLFLSNLDMGNLSGTQQALQDLYSVHIWIYSDELQPAPEKIVGNMIHEFQLPSMDITIALNDFIWKTAYLLLDDCRNIYSIMSLLLKYISERV